MGKAGIARLLVRVLVTAGLLAVQPVRAGAQLPRLPAGARDALLAGEVVLESRDAGDEATGARASILVDAPVERVWSVIVSCAMAHAFVAGLRQCEVLEERGDYALTHQVVDKGWTTPRLDYTFETRRIAYRRMDFDLVRGNLKRLHGSWTFERFREGLLLHHELVLDPTVPAPRWLVRRNLRQDLPDMLRCIRALADGSATPERARADRAACPGDPVPASGAPQ